MPKAKAAKDCNSMTELRHEIDAIDTELLDLLALRATYIDRAVDLKRVEGLPARIHDRVAEVINNVKSKATKIGFDAQLAESIWSQLIEWSIQRESKELDR